MFKTTLLTALVSAQGSNGFSRGVPPVTTNCRAYPPTFEQQDVAWGLTVDREFGGCRCADQDEMEFAPNRNVFAENTWRCQCLNEDLYLSQPELKKSCKDKLTGNMKAY